LTEETESLLATMRDSLEKGKAPLLHKMRVFDIKTYLPDDILAKVDRMSMSHALEVRSPFLGRKVADFAAKMAADDLCGEGKSKKLLKHLAARYIPEAWLARKKKGFAIPQNGSWSPENLARDISGLLESEDCRLRKWIKKERLEKFSAFHQKTPRFAHMWPVFVLEKWLRSRA
jgi:asparagine synthase (glutamine-hydrolysing)